MFLLMTTENPILSEAWWLLLDTVRSAGVLQAQERLYEWHWEMHPMWWWGWGMMAMMFLFWVLFIVGLIVGIRWLIGNGKEQKQDSALEILRERYARGEINKEEFEAKRKDLGG